MKALRQSGWVAVVTVLALAAGFGVERWLNNGERTLDKPAPALVLNDLDGNPQALEQWRGKLLLVNFWAGWCAPCIDEIPLLVEAQSVYGPRGLQIIGPAMDDVDAVRALAAKLRINYPLMADFQQVDAALGTLGNEQGALPYSVLISADGRIVKTILGGLKKAELQALIEDHLPGSSPAS